MGNLIQTLQQAGFQGNALRTAWAIAMRESGGNPNAFNGNSGTGDKSYGLFQVNMLGNLGPARMKQYGLRSERDLLDPATNARVAYQMSNGGRDFGAWGLGPNAYKGAPAAARARFEQFYSKFPGASPTAALGGGVSTPAQVSQGGSGAPVASVGGGNRQQLMAALIARHQAYDKGQTPGAAANTQLLDLLKASNPLNPQGPSLNASPGSLPVQVEHGQPLAPAAGSVIALAQHYLGQKYVFGGASPKTGFDCSGFVQWLYKQKGISLPRTTFDQVKVGKPVGMRDLAAGDIVFFHTESDSRGAATHEGLYIGNGQFIQSPHTGDVIKVSSLSDPYYQKAFITGRRVA